MKLQSESLTGHKQWAFQPYHLLIEMLWYNLTFLKQLNCLMV